MPVRQKANDRSWNIWRCSKYFLITTCFLAMGLILVRFVFLYHDKLMAKVRIYKFYYQGQTVQLTQSGSRTEEVLWSPLSSPNGNNVSNVEEPSEGSNNGAITHSVKPVATVSPSLAVSVPTQATQLQVLVKTTLPMTTQSSPKYDTENPTTISKEPTTVTSRVLCPQKSENLVGLLAVDQTVPSSEDNIDEDWDEKGWVEKGGAWKPTKCQAVSRVAIIIPYRKRAEQLKIFLRHMHPMLKRQLLDYRIFVVEQDGHTPFNRAMLFNIGYKEALKFHDFNCFVFHDVDLIPENDRNLYGCPTSPRHLSVAIDKFNYRLPYETIFGGAGALSREHFELINGFSNRFWGWGGEDDDFYNRIHAKGLKLTRPSFQVARYKMVRIFHKSANPDPERFNKLKDSKERMGHDGLNNLKYHVQKVVEHPLYTIVTVQVDPNAM